MRADHRAADPQRLRRTAPVLAIVVVTGLAVPAVAAEAPTDPAALRALLVQVDDAGRAASSRATVTMQVKTKRYERSVTMELQTQGTEKSLIRIVAPAKDKGVATLKMDDNLWNFLPNTGRTMKVPAAMMSGAWMGSHLSNDDLVRESRFSEDYAFGPGPLADGDDIAIVCTPKPDTPVPWGKVVVTVRPDGVPVRQVFHDEDGAVVRTMSFEDVRDVGGQPVAMTMRLVPEDTQGEFTAFTYDRLELGVSIDASVFTLQSLKK